MIVTLTMNPSIDVAAPVARVVPGRKLRCGRPRIDPGGGGINVSRMVCALGGESACLIAAGGPSAKALVSLLAADGLAARLIPIAGWTRQNLAVGETATGRQFRFVLPGPELQPSEWRRAMRSAVAAARKGDLFVASGSLPPGVPADFYAKLATRLRRKGVWFALDASGAPLKAALASGVDFLKPNRHEFREMARAEGDDWRTIARHSRRLVDKNRAGWILVTRGADGGLLTGGDGQWRIQAPKVAVKSAIGAGDSCMGAILYWFERGWPMQEACRMGIAAAAAAMLAPGTGLARRKDILRLAKTTALWRFGK